MWNNSVRGIDINLGRRMDSDVWRIGKKWGEFLGCFRRLFGESIEE